MQMNLLLAKEGKVLQDMIDKQL